MGALRRLLITRLRVRVLPESQIFSINCQIRIFPPQFLPFVTNKLAAVGPAAMMILVFFGGLVVDFILGRYSVLFYATLAFIITFITAFKYVVLLPVAILLGLLAALGWHDYTQKKRSVLGNYPLMGRFRFIFESIRPELRQYFWESDTDELPFSRNQRSMVYQRAKGMIAARPFGSILDMYGEEHNWLNHSITPSHINDHDFYTTVGEGKLAYKTSVLNISGTSFGALSPPAIQSLSAGAKLGGFAHNTGEGGIF